MPQQQRSVALWQEIVQTPANGREYSAGLHVRGQGGAVFETNMCQLTAHAI